ncbi:MAG: SRPBCC family protein [Actinomycetota bacterium]
MRQIVELTVKAAPDDAFNAFRDLENYLKWLSFIDSVKTVESGNEDLSWIVVLRSQLGPFARMKKLRMVKNSEVPNSSVSFSRVELDGKEHSSWDLEVICHSASEDSTEVKLTVSYSGKFWSRALEAVFNSQVEDAKIRLKQYFE